MNKMVICVNICLGKIGMDQGGQHITRRLQQDTADCSVVSGNSVIEQRYFKCMTYSNIRGLL